MRVSTAYRAKGAAFCGGPNKRGKRTKSMNHGCQKRGDMIKSCTFDVNMVPSAVVPVTARRRAPATGTMPSNSRSTESVVGLIPVLPLPPTPFDDE